MHYTTCCVMEHKYVRLPQKNFYQRNVNEKKRRRVHTSCMQQDWVKNKMFLLLLLTPPSTSLRANINKLLPSTTEGRIKIERRKGKGGGQSGNFTDGGGGRVLNQSKIAEKASLRILTRWPSSKMVYCKCKSKQPWLRSTKREITWKSVNYQ
jgi:hypothetical protein